MAVPEQPTVAEIMRTDVPTVGPNDSVATVARIIADNKLAGVPVVAANEIVGIITEADLIARHADLEPPALVPFLDAIFVADAGRVYRTELRQMLAITAGQLMSAPVINIRSSASLTDVATLILEQRVNPVPVVDDQLNLVGLVSRADLVRVIAKLENIGFDEPTPMS